MEFLNVMLKVWMKYWNLFLQGLGMTLFMGLLTSSSVPFSVL